MRKMVVSTFGLFKRHWNSCLLTLSQIDMQPLLEFIMKEMWFQLEQSIFVFLFRKIQNLADFGKFFNRSFILSQSLDCGFMSQLRPDKIGSGRFIGLNPPPSLPHNWHNQISIIAHPHIIPQLPIPYWLSLVKVIAIRQKNEIVRFDHLLNPSFKDYFFRTWSSHFNTFFWFLSSIGELSILRKISFLFLHACCLDCAIPPHWHYLLIRCVLPDSVCFFRRTFTILTSLYGSDIESKMT